MGLFHVYVEAPDKTPAAITKVATQIGKKYGVPLAELEKRLAAGRFRVKANVDRATADAYAKALKESGARVMIEDAVPTAPTPKVEIEDPGSGSVQVAMDAPGTGRVGRAPMERITRPPEAAAPEVATPLERSRSAAISLPPHNQARSSAPSLPPANAARPAGSSLPPANKAATATRSGAVSLPPANATKSGPVIATGLAAAFSEAPQQEDLGALSTDSLKLASLDGKDTGSQQAITDFAPVDLSPTVQRSEPPPPAPAAPGKKPPKPKDEPVDLFAPPEAAEDAAFKVELAPDEVEHRAKKMSTPPAGVPAAPASNVGSAPVATPQLTVSNKRAQTPAAGVPVTVAQSAQEIPRGRFAAGVFLAIVIGFLPAHLIASSREASAFKKIDAEITAQQDAVDSADAYDALDAFRAAKLAEKESRHRSIAIQSMLIWAVLGGGVAYAWFWRIPWNRLGNKSPA